LKKLTIQLPNQQMESNKNSIGEKGFIGKFLFVDYTIDGQSYLYMEDLKTGKRFHVKNDIMIMNDVTSKDGIIDDVFNTGKCMLRQGNQGNYFYFIKGNADIKRNNIGNISLRNGSVVFIVKTK
jgi:hypothetical protein